MDDSVKRYRERREARLLNRFRIDDEEETNNSGGSSGGGHGNTKLPFGLCQKYGIEVGKDWSPKDAWDALGEQKGISPEGEYAKRKPGITLKQGSTVFRNLSAKPSINGKYSLYGDFDGRHIGGGLHVTRDALIHDFVNKEEMMACLQDGGVTKFKDPDSGEIVNPSEMKLPRTVAKDGYTRYKDLVVGYVRDYKYFGDGGYTVMGKTFDDKKVKLKSCGTLEAAEKYAKEWLKCKPEDLRRTPELKRRLAEKIAKS